MINFNADISFGPYIYLTRNIDHVESYLDLHFICSLDPVLASEMSNPSHQLVISEIRSK